MKRTISIVICGILIFSSLVFSTGCSTQSTYDLDLSKYVSFDGYSPIATLNTAPDTSKCSEERDNIAEKRSKIADKDSSEYENYTDDIAKLTNIYHALGKIEFSLSKGKDGELKNGDTVTIKAKYDKEKIKNYHVDIKSDEFNVKVSGLEEKEVIDPFDADHFELSVSGLDGDGYPKNGKDSDDIYYSFEPYDDLSNGDKVSVTARIDSYDSDFILKGADSDGEVTKEFTVSGLGTVPETIDGVDTTDVDEYMLDEIKSEYSLSKGDEKDGYDLKISDSDYRSCDYKITSVSDYKKVKGIYGYSDEYSSAESRYGVVYSVDVTAKVTDTYSSKIKKGSSKKTTIYYICYSSGFMVNDDNKLEPVDDYYCSVWADSTYKEAKEEMTAYSSDYTYTEVQ